MKKCESLQQPTAKIIGIHSSSKAMSAKPDKAWGLEPCLYLCVGAKVMLRINLLTKHGLVNGATGIVRDIIYAENAKPHDMPISIIVEFKDYSGKPLLGPEYPKCVPIVPFTAQWNDGKSTHTRTQFPLRLAWAMTVHKSQGLTMERAVIDIGKKDIGIGNTYYLIFSFSGELLKILKK